MANKKEELEILEQRTEKDMWCDDLDAFVNEWELQLKEDAEYQKTIRNTNRRASRKIGAGKTTGKGRAKQDDEYNPKPAKAAGLLKVVKVEQKPQAAQRFLSMFEKQAKPKAKPAGFGSDGVEEDEVEEVGSGLSDDDFEALKATKPAKQASRAPSEQPGPSNGRSKRAAAAAPKKWVIDDDESESDDDRLLGDVGAMVKGIGGGETIDKANGRVSLFAMSRPGSSHGRSTSNDLPKVKAKASKTFDFSDGGDETNYEMLARSSPHKAPPAPKDNLDSFLSDEEDIAPIAKKAPVKAAAPVAKVPAKRGPKPKAKPAPVAKKPAEPKPTGLSPAAKAYAAKQSKMKLTSKNIFSDDDEDDDIQMGDSPPPKAISKQTKPAAKMTVISDDEDEDSPPPKPAAKAPASKPAKKPVSKKNVISDDEDEDVDMDDEDSPPKPAARTGRGRPARAAAVVATAKASKKPVYNLDSDDDDDMDVDDLDESALLEEEQSEDDFDDSD